MLADTLDLAITKFLETNKSPSRKVNELDNRGSHFYLALYWAEALAEQDKDADLKTRFAKLAETLEANEQKIIADLIDCQGKEMDISGYYRPDEDLAFKAMRPQRNLQQHPRNALTPKPK